MTYKYKFFYLNIIHFHSTMDYREIISIWTAENPLPAATFLITHGIIQNSIPCPKCDSRMALIRVDFKYQVDGYVYICKKKDCNQNKRLSCRNSSPFLSKFNKTQLQDLIHLVYLWAIDEPNKSTKIKTGLSTKLIILVFCELRMLCKWKFTVEYNGPSLGGPGTIVEIDESYFRHKQKYHRGRVGPNPKWVFGLISRASPTSHAHGVMKIVMARNADTLLPIIQQYVKPGTKVISDQWRAYNHIDTIPGLEHGVVNHSVNFVCRITQNHTQGIESYWAQVKSKLKRMRGIQFEHLEGYLEEHMWRNRNGGNSVDAFANIIRDLALCYE